ncbi:beta-N-acetylhexosaminidase [Longispora fulva]|nr:beta-N-acetylhexosaminidase [Longispora fulva]
MALLAALVVVSGAASPALAAPAPGRAPSQVGARSAAPAGGWDAALARASDAATAAEATEAGTASAAEAGRALAVTSRMSTLVPVPVTVQPATGADYPLTATTWIYADPGAEAPAAYLAGVLRPATGYQLPVQPAPGTGISLLLSGADPTVGDEGYQLDVTAAKVVLRARTAAGLFEGVQSLRQLLPARVESPTAQSGPWQVAGGHIVDHPRYAYRGAMLDVARHFRPVADVERYIDEVARYKINYLHLHLTDDQGWRLVINSWPRLATYGGSTQVGGGPGGYYTQADYTAIVAYAQARHVTIVPEVDMPGHTNAALASYAELNCDGKAPPLYTGVDVGFSTLCVHKELTYRFIEDVVTELAALTPGPYLHLGGDEATSTTPADYATFVNRVQAIAHAHGKIVLGWHDVVHATPLPTTVAQYWGTETSDAQVAAATKKGTTLIMSPASKAYLDMKYTASTPLGQDWAGLIEVKAAYNWDPGSFLSGVASSAITGIEAPVWTETLKSQRDVEYMAFPRLPALAELGWSPKSTHDWNTFKVRLGTQGPRWKAAGVTYYRSPQVPWATS